MAKICSFSGCENKYKGRGYCASHLWQLRKNRELRPLRKTIIGCSVNGCDESHLSAGFCAKHYHEYQNKSSIKRNFKLKSEVLRYYSKKLSNSDIPCCRCCGEHDFLIFLTVDHIINRKNTTHKKGLLGSALYRFLRRANYPSGYQILCVNCNSAKSDSGICPHERSSQ